ncbi:MAG: hypothetical protein ACK4OH_17595 [Acidovorax temperans]|uniref:hypothetical protein n=1 Tax=Acidovorax temperans TaxID=80878 RepID=UPI00391C3E86
MTFKIGPVHRNVPHLLADLVELLLVVGYDKMTHIARQSAEAIVVASEAHSEELDEQEAEASSSESDAEKHDFSFVAMDDVWKVLSYRDKFFGENYPFDIDGDSIRPSSELTEGGRIYRLLLACSRLKSFSRQQRAEWARGFAALSAFALKQGMPKAAQVRIFDANSDDRKNYYSTNLREALKILGIDLHAFFINHAECDKSSSSGDASLDIVGIYPFLDGAAGTLAILGQCAARETEWPSKRFEGNPATLSTYFTLTSTPQHVTFIPLSFRLSTGSWVDASKVTGTLVLDRGRILNLALLSDDLTPILEAEWFKKFEEAINITVA